MPEVKQTRCSKYRILGLVGQGQYGRVYCACHRKTGRLFALKELNKDRFPTYNFLRELRFLLSLQHPNIVRCYALEHTSTGRCLVMDYCEGGTLRHLLNDGAYLHPGYAVKLVADLLTGMNHAHQRGIIHCDIKPENVLLTIQPDGWTARISDFGIARLSQESSKHQAGNTGSPAYMAPERFYGQYSHSSDIYAVGIILFELLAGYRPFSGLPLDLMSAHLNQPVQFPEQVPFALRSVVLKALQKLPARRFRSAIEMEQALWDAAIQLGWRSNQAIAGSNLLLPRSHLPVQKLELIHQEVLQSEVRHLVATSELSRLSGSHFGVTDNEFISRDKQSAEIIYRACGRWVERCRWFGGLFQRDFARATIFQASVPLPEPIQKLVLCPQGCFAITQTAIYRVPFELFQQGVIAEEPGGYQSSDAQPVAAAQQGIPQLVVEFNSDFVAAIAASGRWMVTASLQQDNIHSALRLWQSPFTQAVNTSSVAYLLQLLVLDSHHFATFSHTVDGQTSACITGVRFEGFTRRGRSIGSLNLPIPLQQVVPTQFPYRVMALEPGQVNNLVVIDLKPLRILRLSVGVSPILLAAPAWGYVAIAVDGRIVLLNQHGEWLGQIQGPPNPTAVSVLDSYTLLIATWSQGWGNLVTVDLRGMEGQADFEAE